MEWRRERVMVETERYRIEGVLTLPREGSRSRLSDHVNRRDEEFLRMEDVRVSPLDAEGDDWTAPFLMLARNQIRLIVPMEGG